jgi:hypothetical protein
MFTQIYSIKETYYGRRKRRAERAEKDRVFANA